MPRTKAGPQRPVDHGRPAALGLSVVLRPPDTADAAYRRTGRTRRALQPRLCAVADLRRVAHELLHRPLLPLARRDLERISAAGRRADAWRPSCGRSACARSSSAKRT